MDMSARRFFKWPMRALRKPCRSLAAWYSAFSLRSPWARAFRISFGSSTRYSYSSTVISSWSFFLMSVIEQGQLPSSHYSLGGSPLLHYHVHRTVSAAGAEVQGLRPDGRVGWNRHVPLVQRHDARRQAAEDGSSRAAPKRHRRRCTGIDQLGGGRRIAGRLRRTDGSQPVGINHDASAEFGRIGGRDHRIIDAIGDGEDPRRISGQRHGVESAPDEPVGQQRDLHLDRRLPLELPRDLHVDLLRADEVNMSRQALPAAVETHRNQTQRHRQGQGALHQAGIRKVAAENRNVRPRRLGARQVGRAGIDHAAVVDGGIAPDGGIEFLSQTARRAGEDLIARCTHVHPNAGVAQLVGGVVAAVYVKLSAARLDLETRRRIGHRHAVLIYYAEREAPTVIVRGGDEPTVHDGEYVVRDPVADHVEIRQMQRGTAARDIDEPDRKSTRLNSSH